MTPSPTPPFWRLCLILGRVSNLPTIWTNVWAGGLLGGGPTAMPALLLCTVAISALYVGGMFLNDAFDREVDKVERPERPIPAGWISARAVFSIGFTLLLLGVVCVAVTPLLIGNFNPRALVAAVVLAGLIVVYDAHHKSNALAPWIMGLCRGQVYVTAALALGGSLTPTLALGALSLSGYVVGLTYVARGEVRDEVPVHWPLALVFAPLLPLIWLILSRDLPPTTWLGLGVWLLWVRYCLSALLRANAPVMRSVVHLIAGICVLDAAFAAIAWGPLAAGVGIAGTAATLLLQKVARGT